MREVGFGGVNGTGTAWNYFHVENFRLNYFQKSACISKNGANYPTYLKSMHSNNWITAGFYVQSSGF